MGFPALCCSSVFYRLYGIPIKLTDSHSLRTCQRRIEAKLVGNDDQGGESNEMLFVLKQVLICMDQSYGGVATVGCVNQGSADRSKKLHSAERGDCLQTGGSDSSQPGLNAKVDEIDERMARLGEQVQVCVAICRLCDLRTMTRQGSQGHGDDNDDVRLAVADGCIDAAPWGEGSRGFRQRRKQCSASLSLARIKTKPRRD